MNCESAAVARRLAWASVVRISFTRACASVNVDLRAAGEEVTTTVIKQPLCGVIPRLRIPGTVPGGYSEYPDPLRGEFFNRGCEVFKKKKETQQRPRGSRRSVSEALTATRYLSPHEWSEERRASRLSLGLGATEQ